MSDLPNEMWQKYLMHGRILIILGCVPHVYFCDNLVEIYIHNDGVAMGSLIVIVFPCCRINLIYQRKIKIRGIKLIIVYVPLIIKGYTLVDARY